MGGVEWPTSSSTRSIPCVSRLAWLAFSEEKAIPVDATGPGGDARAPTRPDAKISRNFSFAVTTATFRPDRAAGGMVRPAVDNESFYAGGGHGFRLRIGGRHEGRAPR